MSICPECGGDDGNYLALIRPDMEAIAAELDAIGAQLAALTVHAEKTAALEEEMQPFLDHARKIKSKMNKFGGGWPR